MFATFVYSFKKAEVNNKIIIGYAMYIVVLGLAVGSGVARQHVIPFVPLLLFVTMGSALFLALTQTGLAMVSTLSLVSLIGFQGFRLPLEIILHLWAETGTVPSTMTWTGQNWDIATGVVSLLSIPFIKRSKAVAWLVQIIGFLLLMNVFRVVLMSSPFPFSWPLENPLQLALEFPYVLIVPLFVAPALFCHLLTFRKLLRA